MLVGGEAPGKERFPVAENGNYWKLHRNFVGVDFPGENWIEEMRESWRKIEEDFRSVLDDIKSSVYTLDLLSQSCR